MDSKGASSSPMGTWYSTQPSQSSYARQLTRSSSSGHVGHHPSRFGSHAPEYTHSTPALDSMSGHNPLNSPLVSTSHRDFSFFGGPINTASQSTASTTSPGDSHASTQLSTSHGVNGDFNSQGRAYRSRKDRPCDSCRKRKGRCIITEAGSDCQSCRLNGRSCTFLMSPTPRSRPIKNEDGITITSVIVPRKRSQSGHQKDSTTPPGQGETRRESPVEASDRRDQIRGHVLEVEKGQKSGSMLRNPSDRDACVEQNDYRVVPLHQNDVGNIVGLDVADQDWSQPESDQCASNRCGDGKGPHIASSSLASRTNAKNATNELFSLISVMVQGRDVNGSEEANGQRRNRVDSRSRRGPEEEKGLMPIAIGSSSSEDPMLLRQAGSPTPGQANPNSEIHGETSSNLSEGIPGCVDREPRGQRRACNAEEAVKSEKQRSVLGSLQVRQVASDPHHPIFFAFVPSHPYGRNRLKGHQIGAEGLAELKESLNEKIGHLMVLYSQRDSAAFPLLSETQRREFREAAIVAVEACNTVKGGGTVNVDIPLEPVLANATIATATVYDHSLRPTSKRAWGANLKALTEQFDISTLVTIQVALTDLTGRPSINTSGNFMSFCQTLAISHMLGLHLDCTGWNMPTEEKDVRIRLWWATMIHDKWSSLCWGRPSMIHSQDYTVPLPRRSSLSPCQDHLEDKDLDDYPFGRGWSCNRQGAHTPGDTFVGLCRLTVILSDILDEFHSVRPQQSMHRDAIATAQSIKNYFVVLEDWKGVLPPTLAGVLKGNCEGGQGTESIPGTRSLHLSYLGVNLLLCRAALDSVTKRIPHDQIRLCPAHRISLQGALMIVEFLESMTEEDYGGFFLHYCSHHLASCLSLLGRLCFGFSQLGDKNLLATSVATMQRLLVALSDAHRVHKWDLAELALTRSQAILPALEARIPDFSKFFMANTRNIPDFNARDLGMPANHRCSGYDGSAQEIGGYSSAERRLSNAPRAVDGQHVPNLDLLSNSAAEHAQRSAHSLVSRQHLPKDEHQGDHEPHHSLENQVYNGLPSHGHLQGVASSERHDPHPINAPPGIPSDPVFGFPQPFDHGHINFDGMMGSITLDAAGVPFPIGMTAGVVDSSTSMHNRNGGAYVVDGSTSGAGHLMSGIDFDWLMLPQQQQGYEQPGAILSMPPLNGSADTNHQNSNRGYGPQCPDN